MVPSAPMEGVSRKRGLAGSRNFYFRVPSDRIA